MDVDTLLPDEILALTLWGEARGESIEGQIGVANVIMNRWRAEPIRFKSVKDVCLQPYQFSCWNEKDPNYPKLMALASDIEKGRVLDVTTKQCLYIARGVMGYNFIDNTKGATNYMTSVLLNSNTRPKWADFRKNDVVIGNHTFFSLSSYDTSIKA